MATARRRKQRACAADAPLPPAVVRLYARALEIENEIEEAVADGDYMTVEELLAWSDRLRKRHPRHRRRGSRSEGPPVVGTSGVLMDQARAWPAARARPRRHQSARLRWSRGAGGGRPR
jgi:hypothetical protein